MKLIRLSIVAPILLPVLFTQLAVAQNNNSAAPESASVNSAVAAPPNIGLAGHDFFYAGESKQERMFIVRGGKVVWSYTHPAKGEISDAVLLPNGHVLFAHQHGITEINAQKKVVWNYDAPPNTEIHTVQPYGADSVIFIENGNPSKAIVMNKKSGAIEHEFAFPNVKPMCGPHCHFRRARLTPAGNLMVASFDLSKAVEYNVDGKELWSVDAPGIWGVSPLPNGDVLYSGNLKNYVREVNRAGKTVWEFTAADAPQYKLSNMQTATRLPNGDTLINQWFNEWDGAVDRSNPPVQAIEVTPEKKVVWVLRSWNPPADLGPSTTIQILDKGRRAKQQPHADSLR